MIGEAAGIAAAFCWAIGSVLFARITLAPSAINLFKNSLAGLLLILTVLLVSRGFAADIESLAWLVASSVIGLVIGDTYHFRSLQILGPRRAVTLETLAPPFSVAAGWVFLGERPSLAITLGMVITLLGILFVVGERSARVGNVNTQHSVQMGALYGVLAALGQAVGAALSKVGIQRLESLSTEWAAPLEAACIRLVAASLIGFALAAAAGKIGHWRLHLVRTGEWKVLAPASVVGCYSGVWLSMVAFQRTEVAVATTLTALTPIFVLPLVYYLLRERVSRRAVLGALLAVLGVAVLSVR